ATNLLIQLFNRQMPLNINLFPSHKLKYNDHSIKTFAQHYNYNEIVGNKIFYEGWINKFIKTNR
ncbi:MAG: hypothetical protein PQ967_03810, partial [Methanobacterium sp.]